MPSIDPNLIPTVPAGSLLSQLTGNARYAIRWLIAQDPAYYEVLNRPIADEAVRTLIVAKAVDTVSNRLGANYLFPFLVQPQVQSGSTLVDVPISLIWDMHVSVPQKWERLRLMNVKRMSGNNGTSGSTGDESGIIRFMFGAQEQGSTTESALFYADYSIDSTNNFQTVRVSKPTAETSSEPVIVDSSEASTIDGFIVFKTIDPELDSVYYTFITTVVPPVSGSTGSDGLFTSPAVYEVTDDPTLGDHGTGELALQAWNSIPNLQADINNWLTAFNYPFDSAADRTSSSHSDVVVPAGLFREFNIIAPDNDRPTGNSTGNYFPVYLSRIQRVDGAANSIYMFFSTLNVESPSTTFIEFAKLTLNRTDTSGKLIEIQINTHLFPSYEDDTTFSQGFGRGFVVLSSKWGTSNEIDDFFDSLVPIIDTVPSATFTEASGRLSSYAISRVPKYTPTLGQAQALLGSTDGTTPPSSTNRFITEADQGLGTQVDFATSEDLSSSTRNNADIERYGYTGSLAHRIVKLVVNSKGTSHDYTTDVLPRLRILLGRDPIFGDEWWDGSRKKFYNGDTWIG